jgi:hypothetical protein
MAAKVKKKQPPKPAKKHPAKKTAAKKATASKPAGNTHTLREDYPWQINYANHPGRNESPIYVQSRMLMNKIAKGYEAGGIKWYYGTGDWQDHHGGGLWLYDDKGWFFVKNMSGMEWASQFCADPAKIEILRQAAQRLYAGFPQTEAQVLKLVPGYPFKKILTTPIKTSDDIAQWTDSIFNASVPLPVGRHTGTPPQGYGLHHYPTPVWDIDVFKHDDFVLWVKDAQGQPAAVLPVHPRGVDKNDPAYAKDYGKVSVTYATPGTRLAAQLAKTDKNGGRLTAGPDHPLTKQAFAGQPVPSGTAGGPLLRRTGRGRT